MKVESRNTFCKRLDKLCNGVKLRLNEDIVTILLTLGQACFFIQLDGVKTKRGDCEPVLISWINKDFQRVTITLGLGYETGKGAEDSANNVRQQLKNLGILKTIKELEESESVAELPAYSHFKKSFAAYKESFIANGQTEENAEVAALASYMFGSATADGAIKKLLPELTDSLESTTHHCTAHRLSLVARFAFGQKEQQSIWPPERAPRLIIQHFNKVLDDLVNYFSAASKFNFVEQYAKRKKLFLHTMNAPSQTRFNSMAELLIDIHKNLPIFSSMYTELNHTTEVANEILALIEPQTVIVDGENIVYTPCKEIAKLLPVVNTLKTLSLKAEANDIDAFHLEAHISLFVRQLKGQADFYDSDKVPHKLEKMLEGSVLVRAVVDSLLFATAYYFDLPLATDWGFVIIFDTSSYLRWNKSRYNL